jgi:hypothetical protein
LTSMCSDSHKIIFRLSALVTVMITAMATPDMALPAPSGAAQSPLLDSSYLSYYLRRAAPGRCQARRSSRATPRMTRSPALSWALMISCLAPGRDNSG